MRRDNALRTAGSLAAAAFLVVAGPTVAIAAASPGGSHGNGGNSGSGKAGSGQNSTSRGNSGAGGSVTHANSGGNSAVSGQTNTGSSSSGKSGGNSSAPDTQSNNGSDNPAATPTRTPATQPTAVVVAEQHTGTTAAGHSWWAAPAVAPPAVEVHMPAAPREDAAADLLSAAHTGVPVWAAAEPVGLRSDLFGLAGLVLMPLVGLVVGYRQAKAVRDADLTIGP
ncbi:hypothetical protein [Mycolicibacterium sp. HS_4_1]